MASNEDGKATEAPFLVSSAVRDETMVVVEVGPSHMKFHIHQAVLIKRSDYFRGALRGGWTEAQDRKIVLEDVEIGTFNIFVIWIYNTAPPDTFLDGKGWSEATKESGPNSDYQMEMLKVVVFADRFQVHGLRQVVQNDLIDHFREGMHVAGYHWIKYAFENLPQNNPLLAYFVDAHCLNWYGRTDDEEDRKLYPLLPRDFLLRVVMRMGTDDWDRSGRLLASSYHEHTSVDEQVDCFGCMDRDPDPLTWLLENFTTSMTKGG